MIKRKTNSNTNDILGARGARILYYDFFAGLFLYDLLLGREDLLKKQIDILKQHPLSDDSLLSFNILHKELNENGIKNFVFEYTYLFMLPFTTKINKNTFLSKQHKNKLGNDISPKSVVLYLSYYIDGTIAGKGLGIAKQLVKQSKVRINDIDFKENEEHFGFLLLFMKHLLQNNNTDLSIRVFKECIKPMQSRIIDNLYNIGDSYLYFNVSRLLNVFMDIESGIIS